LGAFGGGGAWQGKATLHGRGKPTDQDPSSSEFSFLNRIYPNHPLPLPPPFRAATNNTGATFCDILYCIIYILYIYGQSQLKSGTRVMTEQRRRWQWRQHLRRYNGTDYNTHGYATIILLCCIYLPVGHDVYIMHTRGAS